MEINELFKQMACLTTAQTKDLISVDFSKYINSCPHIKFVKSQQLKH